MADNTGTPSTLTKEAIDGLDDILDALSLLEDNGVSTDALDSFEDVQMRLKCHMNLQTIGNVKKTMDKQIKGLGINDSKKREVLSKIVKDVRNIYPPGPISSTARRQVLVEDLLNKDGTTDNIRIDCDLRINSLKEKECVILVSGESSAGKSSLLNLLLGEEILPSHMLPCTSCITVIKYNAYRCANVVYKDGTITKIPNLDKEGLELLQQRAYFSKSTDGKNQQEIYDRRKESHNVAEIQVYLPLEMLYSGLVLVDTPGVGENEFLENYLMEYIRSHHILGFMYIIMTDSALGVAEDRLVNLMTLIIKSQKSSNDVIKFNPKAALFVCNRWDMVPPESKQSVRENALKQLHKAWPEFDPANTVFFSTAHALRELRINEGYITDEYVALLHGLHKLIEISLDKRLKASYRWLGNVLQRSVHYLRTMVKSLDMSDKQRQKRTEVVSHKLKILNHRAADVIKTLYSGMEVAVSDVCNQVCNYLKTGQAKDKLTKNWGKNPEELPDMGYASGTWQWVKRHIDAAFDDRLSDLLDDWDQQAQYISQLEKKLFRDAKLQLCELESELADVEKDVQEDDTTSRVSSMAMFNNLCRSLEDFSEEDLIDNEVPKKLMHRLRHFMTKKIRKKHDESKLKEFEKNPGLYAQKRAEKLLDSIIKDKDSRLEIFVRELLQRPFNYIKRLENKIPNLIKSNMALLQTFEREIVAEIKGRKQYVEMMERIEGVRRDLLVYGEGTFFVNDFQESDITLLTNNYKAKHNDRRESMRDVMNNDLMNSRRGSTLNDIPGGLWHGVHLGEITKGSEVQHVVVKIYNSYTKVDNILQEVAKLRCLLHNDVCIAEFLGVYQQLETPYPAMIFSGKLYSVQHFMKVTPNINTNKMLQETAAGLQYLHSKGLVHMELNRSTITVSSTGDVKLTGECIPRSITPPDDSTSIQEGYGYLAPEVLLGQPYISCADMYAFTMFALEIKLPNFDTLLQLPSRNVGKFLKMSIRHFFEKDIRSLALSQDTVEKLLCCLDVDIQKRPDAASLVYVLKLMERAASSKNVVTPKTIWRTFSTTKKKKTSFS
ncbi:hypothetical protein ACF0H5_014185 [Mactra antiquata]